MAEKCDFAIAQEISSSCESPQIQGLKNTGYIINYDDIDWDALKQTDNVVSTFALKKGKRAYKVYVPGKTPFSGTNTTMTTGNYRNKFTKTAVIIILNSGPDVAKNIIDQLANGRFVFVFENKFRGKDDKNVFEIYGLEQGLVASALANEKYSEETDGGWTATLEETMAPSSGIFFHKESAEVTRAALESMVAAPEES